MLSVRVDTRQLQQKLRRIGVATSQAELETVKLLGKAQVDFMAAASPKDTNRYVRGWLMAGNAAGVGRWIVPPLKPSRLNQWLLGRLETQLVRERKRLETAKKSAEFWERMHQTRYANIGRHDKQERLLLQKKAKADKRVEKLTEIVDLAGESLAQLKSDPTALVIWGRKTKSDTARGRIATVRDKEYGGTGRVLQVDGRAFVQLHNLEPHTSIVEKQQRIVARSIAALRSLGLRRASKAYKDRIRRAA